MAPILEDRWREHDWVLSLGSNVHASNHRGWFVDEEFTPFESSVGEAPQSMEVKGIGTVKLELDCDDENGCPHMLVLENVLYIPALICNVVGLPILSQQGFKYHTDFTNLTLRLAATGDVVGNFDKDPLIHLRLHGREPGSSIFDQDVAGQFRIKVTWPATEEGRWNAFKAGQEYDPSAALEYIPYTTTELAWLKKKYGSEFKFLQNHHLSIHSQEERTKGLVLAREEMKEGYEAEKPTLKKESAPCVEVKEKNLLSTGDKENMPPDIKSEDVQSATTVPEEKQLPVAVEAKQKKTKWLPPHVRINMGLTVD